MIKRIIKLFNKNYTVRIVCVCSAAILWLYVSSGQNMIAKFPTKIPIKAINAPANLVPVFTQNSTEIKIMAAPSAWQKLSADSFSATVDLSTYHEGTFDVPVTITSSISGVAILSKDPDTILVSLEPVITKSVPIVKRVEGSAVDGMTVGSIGIADTTGEIKGPKSQIDSISEVIATVSLNGESNSFTRDLKLSIPPASNLIPDKIEITPKEVSAVISIIKGSNLKTVGVKASFAGELPSGLFLSDISLSPNMVELTGSRDILSNIKYVETQPIDLSQIKSDWKSQVSLQIPDGTALGSGNIKISVEIKVASLEKSRTISVSSFKFLNYNQDNISSIDTSEVFVTFNAGGANPDLYTSSDFAVNLDFSGRDVASKSVVFDLTPKNITAPDGVNILFVSPRQIRVLTR